MTAITPNTLRTTTTTPGSRIDQFLAGLGARAEALGGRALRYGLVLILLWIGAVKFTAVEAQAIRPFVPGGARQRLDGEYRGQRAVLGRPSAACWRSGCS